MNAKKGPDNAGPLLRADVSSRSSVMQLLQAPADVVSHMFEIPHIFLLSSDISRCFIL